MKYNRRIIAPLLLLALQVGCNSLDLSAPWKSSGPTVDGRHPINEIVTLWQPAEGQGLDNMPTRGFAGQLLFFAHGYDEPVRIDGDVRIYLFDDRGENPDKPIHQFDFPAEILNAMHLRRTDLGQGYHLFLPYTRPGSRHAHCAIRVRYTPRDGRRPTFSETASVDLQGTPGTNPQPIPSIATAREVRQVDWTPKPVPRRQQWKPNQVQTIAVNPQPRTLDVPRPLPSGQASPVEPQGEANSSRRYRLSR